MIQNQKPALRFGSDGKFRILVLSDFQEAPDSYDPRTLAGCEKILDALRPDLVVLAGDNVNGPAIHGEEDLKTDLGLLLMPFEKRGIPWCHVFGNHDHDAAVPLDRQMELYQSFPHCLSTSAPGVPGSTNFLLPIYDRKGEEICFALWGLDSGNRFLSDSVKPRLAGRPNYQNLWDRLSFEQIRWYWDSSLELERTAGRKIPSLMVFHIAPWEFNYMRSCEDALKPEGFNDEDHSLGVLNSGLFSALVERGDVRAIACGHTHENTCAAEYCGILMSHTGSAGYSAYGAPERKGGRLFEISEDNPQTIHTAMHLFTEFQ